jgi:hypothetical protein
MPNSNNAADLEAWVSVRLGLFETVRRLERPELMRYTLNEERFADDPPGTWIGDELYIPLWLYTLIKAFELAVIVPPTLTLERAVGLVEKDVERQEGLAALIRLAVFRPGAVITQLLEWEENSV